MLEQLLQTLIASENTAADDVLLEAVRRGNEVEKAFALDGLLQRQTRYGLSGLIGIYEQLPDSIKLVVLQNIKLFHTALRECGRSEDLDRRQTALKLVALGRQGKLAYILSENLYESNETLAKVAVDAIVALARWVATETRRLQDGSLFPASEDALPHDATMESVAAERAKVHGDLIEQRPEIEQAVARAMDVHRGKHGAELLRAALLLCDWSGSRTLAILQTAKHGGQSPMVRRLQQPPASEHVEAFLLGASHGQLRSHFGAVFAHIDEAPVLDAMLRKTHWLKDLQLQLCLHQVNRGTWFGEAELLHDIERRDAAGAARIGDWIGASGLHDMVQDERLEKLRVHAADDFSARLRLLRIALKRPRRTSVQLLRAFLSDPDERIVRMAARDIVRRRPPEFENILLQLMTSAPASVRRVVSRSIGQAGFDLFWQRFDRLDRNTRKAAGRAMFKMLPDAGQRLSRRLSGGPIEERLKAMQVVHELGMAESMRAQLTQLCTDSNPKIRSRAVSLCGDMPGNALEVIMDRVLKDSDARVRANAIEVLENTRRVEYLPLLAERARAANNRERANAIKALHKMKVKTTGTSLMGMLRDARPEHRISAMWAMKQIGLWDLIAEVGRLAKADQNLRVRRYALGVLKSVAEQLHLGRLNQTG